VRERVAQRSEDELHVARPRVVAHKPNAPHLASRGAEAARDLLQIVLRGDKGGDVGPEHAVGDVDRRHGGQAVRRVLHKQREPHGLQPLVQLRRGGGVAGPQALQPLIGQQRQRLAQAVDAIHGKSVPVGARLAAHAPVLSNQIGIEIPRTNLALSSCDARPGALVQHQKREAGRRTETLLRASVGGVHGDGERDVAFVCHA